MCGESGSGAAMRKKKCRICKEVFQTQRSTQIACSLPCAIEHAERQAAKKKAKQLKARKEGLLTKSDWENKLQPVFNAYIRERDYHEACICCGRFPLHVPLTGGRWDAGHYRSVGSAPHLRFDERNCHKQLKQCNRDKSGNAVDYRLGLIKKIGLEAVEAIEADQAPKHYSIDDLKAMLKHYRAETRRLKKERLENEAMAV